MKVFLETYGCDTNKASTEIMAAQLLVAGHTLVGKKDAELTIINSCVLEPTVQRKVLKRITELRDANAKALVMGCMGEAQRELILQKMPSASVAGVASVSNIAEIVGKIQAGNQVIRFNDKARPLVGHERIRINQAAAIVQIAEGCLDNCAFCIDRSLIGSLRSYDPDKILREIKDALGAGCIEIQLSAQDVASFGLDSKVRLPALLRKICVLEGKYRVKLGPMNPANVLAILDDLIPAFNRPNMYQYLDLPLQSGSDKVLGLMNRKYNSADYKKIVHAFRERYPTMTLSTDVIAGFPEESDEDYKQTLAVLAETKPDILNVYAYGDMPLTKGGPSNVPSWKIKDRFMELNKLSEKYREEHLAKWLNWSGEIYVTEKIAEGHVGRNYAYAPVLLKKAELGQIGATEIGGAENGLLIAR